MYYAVDLTVPANTAASAPVTEDVQLAPGVIQQVDVQFPSGCVGLVHTQCRRGAHQVWPSNPGGDFASNGQTLTWQDEYELDDAPFLVRLYAWNLDDTYDHVVTWRFSVRRFAEAPRQQLAEQRASEALQLLEVDV